MLCQNIIDQNFCLEDISEKQYIKGSEKDSKWLTMILEYTKPMKYKAREIIRVK